VLDLLLSYVTDDWEQRDREEFFEVADKIQENPEDISVRGVYDVRLFIENVISWQGMQYQLGKKPAIHKPSLSSPEAVHHKVEYTVAGEVTPQSLDQILAQIMFPGRLIVIYSYNHSIGLIEYNNKYCLFNPNEGEECYERTEEDLSKLFGDIFRANRPYVFLKNGVPTLSLSFQVVYFKFDDFNPEYIESPHYPNQQSLSAECSITDGLFSAAQIGCMESVKSLVKTQSDINKLSKIGITSLVIACQYNHYQVVEYLIEQPEINVNNALSYGKTTALYLACQLGHIQVVNALLKHPNIDAAKMVGSWTPLNVACYCGHYAVVEALLVHKGSAIWKEDKNKSLQIACDTGQNKIVELLEKHNTEPSPPPASTKTCNLG